MPDSSDSKNTVKKLLAANRSEIATRIFRGATELGLRTVAIYAEEDRFCVHRFKADEAYRLSKEKGPVGAYLDIDGIISIAKERNVDAIHPGYGFLSENADFANACKDNGIVFVGPRPEVLASMGDKIAARKKAAELDVPILAGNEDPISNSDEAIKIAKKIGFPLIIKAAFGGGGRGMRVVKDEKHLIESIEITKNEAELAFGSNEVFMEKFLENPRHIEFQVLADQFGNAICLGERDCSMQRKHQKVIEEAPAPGLSQELREKMMNKIINASKEIGYIGAGTFEFLYQDNEFYFIEMNTRIQVEHPVTEMITGIDIVRQQLLIASGKELGYKQEEVELRGHAIECRINAENPNNFTPSPGKINTFHATGGPGVRMDTHIYNGYYVPPFYDSMIGKLISYGNNRDAAIRRMLNALGEIVVDGIETNVNLHKSLLTDNEFRKGGVNIHYLEKKLNL